MLTKVLSLTCCCCRSRRKSRAKNEMDSNSFVDAKQLTPFNAKSSLPADRRRSSLQPSVNQSVNMSSLHNIPSIRTECLSTASLEEYAGKSQMSRRKSASTCANVPSSRQSSNSSCATENESIVDKPAVSTPLVAQSAGSQHQKFNRKNNEMFYESVDIPKTICLVKVNTFCHLSSLDSPSATDRAMPSITLKGDKSLDRMMEISRGSSRISNRSDDDLKESASYQQSLTLSVKSYSSNARRPSREILPEMLQPDLYKTDASTDVSLAEKTSDPISEIGSVGQIHFSARYDLTNKCLTVKIVEARELIRPGRHPNTSNPYIKVVLLPDRKQSRQTTVKRKTSSPLFEELFHFDLSYEQCLTRALFISVIDFDRTNRNHCLLGVCEMPLKDAELLKGGHYWRSICPPPQDSEIELGEILLALQYLPSAQELNVDVIRASSLLQTDLVGGCDPFVKVVFLRKDKILKSKQTEVRKDTLDPEFNESFRFRISASEMDDCSLVVSVWDRNSKSKDDFVGRVILGHEATGDLELLHWSRVKKNQREFISEWHALKSRKDCDFLSRVSSLVP